MGRATMTADHTPFNKQAIGQSRPKQRKRKRETISEQQTGYTPEQLREQQEEMRRLTLARFLPGWTPREGPDEEPEVEEEETPTPIRQKRPSRAQPQKRKRSPAPRPERICQGCGAALPPQKSKWCSETCRQAYYAEQSQPCVSCGGPTAFGPRNRIVKEPRCSPCVRRLQQAPTEARRKRVIKLLSQGVTRTQVAVQLGCHWGTIARDLRIMREAGIDIPDGRSAKSRALRQAASVTADATLDLPDKLNKAA